MNRSPATRFASLGGGDNDDFSDRQPEDRDHG
jgi:hypothetical protein